MSATGLILATQSPRRRELFSLITPAYRCVAADVDESSIREADAARLALALGRLKAGAVFAQFPGDVVVGCDTVVEIDGEILGKPHSKDEARAMITRLAGRRHNVHTGVCILGAGEEHAFNCVTSVEFYPMTAGDIERYIETDEPYDKAGAYGIQGLAARFVRGIRGDYFNVMGLPVSRIYNALRELGCI